MSEFDRMESNELRHQDLRGLDLTGSDLRGASLCDTDLREVDFAGARGELIEELKELRERVADVDRLEARVAELEDERDAQASVIADLQRANTALECERDDLRARLAEVDRGRA